MAKYAERSFVAVETLTDGTEVVIDVTVAEPPLTVWVRPAAGDSVAVSYSLDNGVTYEAWPSGAVTAFTQDTLNSGATHIKFQRITGTGTTSTCGVC